MVQAQEEHAKTTTHAEQVSHNIDSELSKSNARKQQDMHKWTTRIGTRTQETRTCMRKNKYSMQKQLEYAWRSSGTLLNTAGRVWTLLNNIE